MRTLATYVARLQSVLRRPRQIITGSFGGVTTRVAVLCTQKEGRDVALFVSALPFLEADAGPDGREKN